MRLGVDLGGTKIEAAALDDAGAVVERRRVATPQGDYPATLAAIEALAREVLGAIGTAATIGIGIPGALSLATGLVKQANSTCLIGQPLEADLESLLGQPVRLANDANCFALSEAHDGAAAGARTVFGVILGTGVGGGLVTDGQIQQGRHAIAGEWGHNPLPWPRPDEIPGPDCYCGKRGCIETFVSGPALARAWQGDPASKTPDPESTSRGAEALVQAAEAGDLGAEALLQTYEDRLARALAMVINILDPEAIVLGGGLSNLDRLYRNLPPLLPAYAFSDEVTTPLLPPRHGDSSGVRGAARLWSPREAAEAKTGSGTGAL